MEPMKKTEALDSAVPLARLVRAAIQPFEVSYTTTTGSKGKRDRNVIGVLCPTAIAQYLGFASPIFVALGDVKVDWNAPQTEGYRAMFDVAPNV